MELPDPLGESRMKPSTKLWVAGLFLLALFYFWPNMIHEPLHLLALEAQGSSGTIAFDWSFPPHPSTSRLAPVAGIAGGLLFALLPSIVSIGILFVCWFTRKRAGLITHIMLPIYLAADLVINIGKFASAPYSDFRFLTAVPFGSLIAIILCLSVMTFAVSIILNSIRTIQEHKVLHLWSVTQ